MRRWATGVTIVTAAHDGAIVGMTVSSFTSVSLEPPQVLVTIEHGTRTHAAITQSDAFAVSVLDEGQQAWSARFGGQLDDDGDRFAGVATFTRATGSPILNAAMAFLDCRVVAAHEAATHTIFVGLVEASGVSDGARRPLVYYNQGYRYLADDHP
jgi:flavin reductase (DIM6/NTAB) family NADH-FMN oxidoreductase RutF